MLRLLNVLKQGRQLGLTQANRQCVSHRQENREEKKEEEEQSNSQRSKLSPMLLMGVAPLLVLLNEKMRNKVNCIFFGKKAEVNEMEKVSVPFAYPANLPIEDRHDCQMIQDGKDKGYLLSVFDGHGGWQVAEFCQNHLSKDFQQALDKMTGTDRIEQALNEAYDNTEKKFLDIARMAYQSGFGQTGKIGACAVSVYVTQDKMYCANSGDSQSVIISQEPEDGKYKATKMNKKLNAMSKKEQERLRSSHPHEEDIVRCKSKNSCYVKGVLQPTRSFGDFRLKYADFNDPEQHGVVKGYHRLRSVFKGPYITHRPQIRVFNRTKEDQFIIIGSDGLWDELSAAQVAKVVETCINSNPNDNRSQLKNKISQNLFQMAFNHAAKEAMMTPQQLKMVPQGRDRRNLHDDITILVLDLQQIYSQ